jgi:hypothetical protein
LKRYLTIAAFAAAGLLLVGSAGAAVIRVGNLVLRADGGFEPRTLPRRAFAPIRFQGYVDISATGGGVPAALQQAVLEFDRDGRLSTRGLPTCSVEQIAEATPQEARAACKNSIVGTGHVTASIALPGQAPVLATSPLTLFNGQPENGDPTVILHARTTVPATQTFAVVVPIERRSGAFGYRATINVPAIAGGYGALTHIDAKIGRLYSVGKRRLSYVSARCSRGILQTQGRFSFANGTVMSGAVSEPCEAR